MSEFKFIDLFAGIGGFHIAMESIGGTCVFASEIDEFSRKTYEHNFSKSNPELFKNGMFNDDIRKITPSDLPDFDVLCAGFPCQPFSQAGYKRGFDDHHDSERGNLFFNIVDILEAKRPKAFFLENVRGIVNHDGGKTFQVIRELIQNELGYSFHHAIIKASDYGLPQLRPRVFMIGFRDEGTLSSFSFPPQTPLEFTMSDVWGGVCTRDIGFTLRVGGRGSSINDRRNWDSYIVDGTVKQLSSKEAKKMQGFPDSFHFPVSEAQAMKQLGNSVAINAVRECGKALIKHLGMLSSRDINMNVKKNKGEWSELYSFLKIINDKKLLLSDANLNINHNADHFTVKKLSTLNIDDCCYLDDSDEIIIKNKTTGLEKTVNVSELINKESLTTLANSIKNGSNTFEIPQFTVIQEHLGLSIINGGNSNQKSDITLDIENNSLSRKSEGFSIKSYLGSKPTLLNASNNTNFIYKVTGLNSSDIDLINAIDGSKKIIKRIEKIKELGGSLSFRAVEKETMNYNLNMIDSSLPTILSEMILEFYMNRTSKINENIKNIALKKIYDLDLTSLQVKVKRLLVASLLGFFPGYKWDGNYISNGVIVVKDTGEQVGFHIIDKKALEEYLFENIRFDTPSTTRHRFGSVYIENDGKLYFKLNLQLRF